jgi:TonB family protein
LRLRFRFLRNAGSPGRHGQGGWSRPRAHGAARRGAPLTARIVGVALAAFATFTGARMARAAEPAPAAAVTPPVVVRHVDAVYPPSALAQAKDADVVLALTVDVDGHVSKVDVLQSGGADLDEAAIVAGRQWTFVPAIRNGKPVASRIRVPFHFAPPAPPPEVVTPPPPPEPEVPTHQAVPQLPAAAPTQPEAERERTPDETEDVEVIGHMRARPRGAADYQIEVGQLATLRRSVPLDLLKLAPGVLLTNEGGEGHAEQVFLRGFDAREGQDLEFTVDGVPINDAGNLHGNGYADTHFIIPELVRSLRVLEGPYAPQQGNFAVAGSADFQLGLDRRGLTARYETGSYNTQRLLLTWGPEGASTGTFAGAEYYSTNGFGQNRQARRGTAIGQYEAKLGRGSLRVTGTGYITGYNSAGLMREDDFDSGRKGFYDTEDPNQTGNESSRYSLALTYELHLGNTELTQQVFLIDRTMRLRENFTGFVEDVQEPTQEPHGQRGDLIDLHFDEITLGARGAARWRGRAFSQPQEVEIGYYARGDQTHSQQYRLMDANQAPYKTEADLASTLGDIGVYVDANLRVLPWIALRGGIRAETFLFDVLNNCAVPRVDSPSKTALEIDVSCLSEQEHGVFREPQQRSSSSAGAVLPKATLLVGPIRNFELALSYGSGVRTVDPIDVAQGLDTPFVRIQSEDLGVSYARTFAHLTLSAKSTFFRTHVDRDLIFDQTQGRATLANGTTRTGWAAAARATGEFFDEAANVTLVRSTFDDTHLLVPYVPDVVVRSDTALFTNLPWKLAGRPIRGTFGYGLSYVGRRPLPFGQLSDVIFVSDASLRFNWSIWEIGVTGQNIFNTRYKLSEYNFVSDFHKAPAPTLVPERLFSAGPPLTVLFTIAATLGGGS